MLVVCCCLFVVCCLLIVARCLLFVVCLWMWFFWRAVVSLHRPEFAMIRSTGASCFADVYSFCKVFIFVYSCLHVCSCFQSFSIGFTDVLRFLISAFTTCFTHVLLLFYMCLQFRLQFFAGCTVLYICFTRLLLLFCVCVAIRDYDPVAVFVYV